MRHSRSASVSTVASFASALSGAYETPPLASSSESYFSPAIDSEPDARGYDFEDQAEASNPDSNSNSSGPSTPRARPNLVLDDPDSPPPTFTVNGKGKGKGSFWLPSSTDDGYEDGNEDEDDDEGVMMGSPTKTKTWTAKPQDEHFLERLSMSSRGTLHGSPVIDLDGALLELGIGIDDVASEEGSSLPSEDYGDLQEDEWNELDMEEGEHIPLTSNSGIRMDADSAPQGGRRRKRRKWRAAEEEFARGGHKELWQLVPPQLLSYPLAFLPLIPLLPASFLPGGAAVFIPVIAIITGLSACAHVVTVYLSRYLKVTNFEDILHRSAGKYGLWAGRGLQIVGILCTCTGWLRAIHPIWLTFIRPLSNSNFLASRWLVLIVSSFFMLPLPTRAKPQAGISLLPDLLILLLPMIVFTVIGRTVEISELEQAAPYVPEQARERYGPFGMENLSSGTALVTVILFNTPHVQTLPIHGSLIRTSRTWFPLPCLIAAGTLLVMVLPYSLVPYYLFNLHEEATGLSRAGIFAVMQRPEVDGALNFARLCMIALTLTTANQWVGQARAVGLRALGVEREGRAKAQRWLGFGAWITILFFAGIGGWVADQLEIIGGICILAIGWLVPAILFVKNFYISSPLAIVFPSSSLAAQASTATREIDERSSSVDILLARKERELQKRRTGRRLWQDLIVFIGILPIGMFTIVWLILLFLGVNI